MSEVLKIVVSNFSGLDVIIFAVGIINAFIYMGVWFYSGKVYKHFNQQDRISNLPPDSIRKLRTHTSTEKRTLSMDELLNYRTAMNFCYSLFTNFTALFPLLGMFGTVTSLIPMVNMIGTDSTTSFFAALTSTFWGILFAVIGKTADAFVAYKIDDCEEHMQPYIAPHEDATVGE